MTINYYFKDNSKTIITDKIHKQYYMISYVNIGLRKIKRKNSFYFSKIKF